MSNRPSPNTKGLLISILSMAALFAVLYFVCQVGSSKTAPVSVRSSQTQAVTQTRKYYTYPPRNTYQYIGNKRSHVFHKPSCSSVSQMNDYNRVYFESRQAALDKDYSPCGRCHP